MNIYSMPKRHRSAAMTLLALETMPCGCVAGVYQARPSVVEVEFVEAKGPHCVFSGHRAGRVPEHLQLPGRIPLAWTTHFLSELLPLEHPAADWTIDISAGRAGAVSRNDKGDASQGWWVMPLVILFGVACTIYSEWMNTTIRASWSYGPLMPVVPWIGTGRLSCSGSWCPRSRSA